MTVNKWKEELKEKFGSISLGNGDDLESFIEKAIIEAKIEALEKRNKSIQKAIDWGKPKDRWGEGYISGLDECINANEEIIEELEQLKTKQ